MLPAAAAPAAGREPTAELAAWAPPAASGRSAPDGGATGGGPIVPLGHRWRPHTLRLRLALWYGGLTGIVVVLACLYAYAVHARTHYDQLDASLAAAGEHVALEIARADSTPQVLAILSAAAELRADVRLFDASGRMLARSSPGPALPVVALTVLANDGPPAYPLVARLAPVARDQTITRGGSRAFGLSRDTAGRRWRLLAMRLPVGARVVGATTSAATTSAATTSAATTSAATTSAATTSAATTRQPPVAMQGRPVAVLTAAVPLDQLDTAMRRYGWQMVAMALIGSVLTFGTGWWLARRVLRPVALLTETARTIAASGTLSARVPVTEASEASAERAGDELAQLAHTFNAMLARLEAAHAGQQRFIADAAHELRAPLTAVRANLQLLRRAPPLAAVDREEAVRDAGAGAERLHRLVRDLLALARADAGQRMSRRPVELDRVVLDVVREGRALIAAQASDVTLAVDTLEPAVTLGDADRLHQLVLVLVDNALKYTPAGGRVAVALRVLHTAPAAPAASRSADATPGDGARAPATIEVRVTDTGVGIAAEELPHVFERFYRAATARARDGAGSGLGLSIARWIAEGHGGTVTLASTPGVGTTATVHLPLRPPAV